ncbi:MAG: hypothetical protein ACR2FS_15240 [Phormidesmis sp.]
MANPKGAGRKDGLGFSKTNTKATIKNEHQAYWEGVDNKARFVREAIAEKIEREWHQMRIVKGKSGFYYAADWRDFMPEAFPKIVYWDSDEIQHQRSVDGHGETYDAGAMALHFSNWEEFPELHDQTLFFLDLQDCPKPYVQTGKNTFEPIACTEEWLLQNG